MTALRRVRERSVRLPQVGSYKQFFHTGETAGPFPESSYITRLIESMFDVTGNEFGVHPCSHDILELSPYPALRFTNTTTGDYVIYDNVFIDVPNGALEQLISPPSPNLVAELADKAYDALVPQIPQEISIPNFLYELRALGDLIPKLEEGIVKTAGSGFLNYSFGWKPFIGDIQTIMGLMNSIRARLEYLKETWGRETRISYQTDYDSELEPEADLGGNLFAVRESFRGTFRCSGYLYHELEDLDGLVGEMRALTAATGFNNPLGVIWEAIPFSFVADWFTRAGSLISKTPIQPFVGPWEIRRLTHSFTVAAKVRFEKRYFGEYTHSGHGSPDYVFSEGTFKGYIRGVGLPVSSAILSADGLNPQQQLLAAALLSSAGR